MTAGGIAAVFAHPDDETFSVGGTVRRYASAGVPCGLYCATDGDAGRASGLAVASPAELGRVRRGELEAAARILGFDETRFGGRPDGRLTDADPEPLIGDVVLFLRDRRPQVVLTFGPEGAPTGHRDHRAISRLTTAAFFLAGLPTAYPEQLAGARTPFAPARLYYVSWPPPGAGGAQRLHAVPATARVEVSAQRAVQREAFQVHRTQHDHRAAFELEIARGEELYALAAGIPQSREIVVDLLEGL
ncbi:MAG TPA: PIG-L family deacetylase [Gemmatimonadaceae bacterium]|nr:PIG-L family deacetylase [Gemmatimonadaceae bacterium]